MFPEVIRAASELQPAAIVVENVRGLLRSSFRPYLDYVLWLSLYPRYTVRSTELARTRRKAVDRCTHFGAGVLRGFQLVNAADFGVPQSRHRVIITAVRVNLGQPPRLSPTHSEDALLFAQYVDGSYWSEHDLEPRPLPERYRHRVRQLTSPPPTQRWRTVRDALRGLPAPGQASSREIHDHIAIPGRGHTLGTPDPIGIDRPRR